MDHSSFERRLTAIFYADMVGYSRLTNQDEEGTHHILSVYMELMTTAIQDWHGHVVNFAGDAVLAAFPSVLDALGCAVEVQRELRTRNEALPDEQKFQFRIGINSGDVIVDRDNIYGDDVNVAARLQNLAEPGGICISGVVHEQVRHKLPLRCKDMGAQRVKNIAEPVHAYRVLPDTLEQKESLYLPQLTVQSSRLWTIGIVMAAILIIAGTVAGLYLFSRPEPVIRVIQTKDPAATENTPSPALWTGQHSVLELPARPSIAVLPFTNLSGDPDQEYFSDGVTNDIITDLSKFHDLFVIASNTMFTYKGRAVKVQKLGHELGVRYVLEGSVQRRGGSLRITAQLIDAASGHHLWADRYDRDEQDLFAVQDDIIQTIVGTLAVKIDHLERERALRKDTDSLKAYDYVMRGWEYLARRTRVTNREARRMFQRAVELDPRYASAYAGLGRAYLRDFWYGWTEFPHKAITQARALAEKALAIDEDNATAHVLLGQVHLYQRRYDLAASELERAIELNPNDAKSFYALGQVRLWSSQLDEAIKAFETGARMDPSIQENVGNRGPLALAYYIKGDYGRAIDMLEQNLSHRPDHYPSYIYLAATYAHVGHQEEAERVVAGLLKLNPFFTVDSFTLFRDPAHNALVAEDLRKAGLR